MGMSRPHLSRVYRPVVSVTVAIAFRVMIERIPDEASAVRIGTPSCTDHRGVRHG